MIKLYLISLDLAFTIIIQVQRLSFCKMSLLPKMFDFHFLIYQLFLNLNLIVLILAASLYQFIYFMLILLITK